MKNFIKSTVKYLYLGIIFSVSVLFTVYAANITGVTGQTISNGDTIGNGWFQDVNNSIVPGGAVMAFNLPSCPTGWSNYTQANGRTIIGAGNGADSNTSVGDTGGEKSAPAIDVKFQIATNKANNETPNPDSYLSQATNQIYFKPSGFDAANLLNLAGISVTGAGTAPDNMQPYVSLLYCQKS